MKKHLLFTTGISVVLTIGLSMTALAGEWKKDSTGWWWERDDKSYPVNTWEWIDDNNDGVAESYYFNENGYMLVSGTSSDGYTVNELGQWVMNGIVQTKAVEVKPPSAEELYPTFVYGYERAEFEKFNSPASENGLGGTDIYFEGTLDKVEVLEASGTASLIGYFSDQAGNKWLGHMHVLPIVDENYYESALGKEVLARGEYNGYSGKKEMPAFILETLLIKETDKELAGMQRLLD